LRFSFVCRTAFPNQFALHLARAPRRTHWASRLTPRTLVVPHHSWMVWTSLFAFSRSAVACAQTPLVRRGIRWFVRAFFFIAWVELFAALTRFLARFTGASRARRYWFAPHLTPTLLTLVSPTADTPHTHPSDWDARCWFAQRRSTSRAAFEHQFATSWFVPLSPPVCAVAHAWFVHAPLSADLSFASPHATLDSRGFVVCRSFTWGCSDRRHAWRPGRTPHPSCLFPISSRWVEHSSHSRAAGNNLFPPSPHCCVSRSPLGLVCCAADTRPLPPRWTPSAATLLRAARCLFLDSDGLPGRGRAHLTQRLGATPVHITSFTYRAVWFSVRLLPRTAVWTHQVLRSCASH